MNAKGWLAVIPARFGSKSIPQKNIKPFLGRPLLEWTVESAVHSQIFERVIVSTDHSTIAEIGRHSGAEVPFLRPAELATDECPTAPVLRHALDWLKAHGGWSPMWVMVLEPTSPSRRTFHILEAAQLLVSSGADSLASISEVPHHYVPSKLLQLDKAGQLLGLTGTHVRDMVHRRQDLAVCYAFNGLIFACKSALIMSDPPTIWGDTVVGQPIANKYCVDLDRLEDWNVAECRMRQILDQRHE